VKVSIAKVESVKGVAVAPGEIAGDAVRLTVRVVNGSAAPLDLGLAVVNAYVGPQRTPAGSLMNPGGKPFGGTLAPGGQADGVYLFVVPPAQRDDVTVTVYHAPDQPTTAFRGPLR
jgi:hypothetical protein